MFFALLHTLRLKYLALTMGAYENAIYKELGKDIAKQLNDLICDIVVDVETLTYTFQNCPKYLIKKILELKKAKGEISILNEYIPDACAVVGLSPTI
jgi:hypothetical protein